MRFPEFEKEVLSIVAKFGCQDIVEYSDFDDPKDRDWVLFPTVEIKLGRFRMVIDVDERWGGVLRFNFDVTYPSKNRDKEDHSGMVFPRKYYPSYLPQEVKLRDYYYQMPATRYWDGRMKTIIEIVLKNRKNLERDCERICLRDERGNAKRHWEEWRSDAKVLEIENYNSGGIVQGIKQNQQSQYDTSPWHVGSNGTYRAFGDNEWIMIYRIKRRAQDSPCPIFQIVSIESFMKEKLMPSLDYKKISAQRKQRILDLLQSRDLVVVTNNFDEYGFVSQDAEFFPVGFHSWDAYLEDLFKDWLK